MNVAQVVWALSCVAAISCGQILFKRTGIAIESAGTWFSWRVFALVAVAATIYAAATLAWINLLRLVPLSTAYSFMALSFVLVPIASVLLFAEKLSPSQLIGNGLIIAGLLVATRGA